MLSYQHSFHAGNAADVQKHALLAAAIAYLTRKPKPLSYIETHAGRGLYSLDSPEARKTGEAAAGVARLEARFPEDHPWRQAIAAARAAHGPAAYPGSPWIAAYLTRPGDRLDLAELHPQEHAALTAALPPRPGLRIHHRDGLEMARALTPPEPRRGLMLIDPSWEIRADYARLAKLLPALHRKWNVGVLMLWYPILEDRRHAPMIRALRDAIPGLMVAETAVPRARAGHGLRGSGLAVVNPPWGLEEEAARVAAWIEEG
ncbi:23S rRNA (adenine(2030)-N(6))-methyltransferase RlmJ [Jannaschia seohaensis]|uniref:Ribosomal RNA large subunit methyltransferase J n=1 Tax=Jannaschia seohaensis TaxID=475081 RepID=A0A2Y9AQH3_9RHOB|nr:23S rRNA (adenine(2030)-N(6))-methyltransferase RlmJ [Jannaschia seohaensis]PWJ18196.1 23S rRNA (adenine2030-N6)-methyltransferase [Jannaschia seohaensis]SSA46721.1 23S rRNA (adenine2030-N6)-methyltransferase [Jannaschia seohaensis]